MAVIARRPTLEDVAREAGVSGALVSIVIRDAPGASEQTRARVLEVAERLGYRPDVRARMLARSSSRLLGITFLIGALHHADLLGPMYEAAEAARLEVILSGKTRHHDERHALNTLHGYRCDGLLTLGPDLPEPDSTAWPPPFPWWWSVVASCTAGRRRMSTEPTRMRIWRLPSNTSWRWVIAGSSVSMGVPE